MQFSSTTTKITLTVHFYQAGIVLIFLLLKKKYNALPVKAGFWKQES